MKKTAAAILALFLAVSIAAACAESGTFELVLDDFSLMLEEGTLYVKNEKTDDAVICMIYPLSPRNPESTESITIVWEAPDGNEREVTEDDLNEIADGYLLGYRETLESQYGSGFLADLTVIDRGTCEIGGRTACYFLFSSTLDMGVLGEEYKGISLTGYQEAVMTGGEAGYYCFILTGDSEEVITKDMRPVLDTLRWK